MQPTNTIDITALTDAAFDRFMEAAAEGSTDRPHIVLPATGEFEAGNGLQIDTETELGVDRADGAVEFEAPAVQIPVQAVLLADGDARSQVEGGLVA